MIEVRVNNRQSGRLSKIDRAGSSFVYGGLSDPEQSVSLTMPVQAPSYDWPYGLLPIFEMNLPEGALRDRLKRDFAKSLGRFDDLDMLAITGRHQIGRVEYGASPEIMELTHEHEPGFQSVDAILKARRNGDLFEYLMSRYAGRSGISGVQPKVLIRDPGKFSPAVKFSQRLGTASGQGGGRQSVSLSSATHIVKLWERAEYPELAANEYFCLRAAGRAGLDVPKIDLSDNGEALIVERFDLDVIAGPAGQQARGHYIGFEDFCVLNGVNASEKYRGSYESKLFRRITDYIAPATAHTDMLKLFKLFVLNVAVRNGDAHLKNFGLTYDNLAGNVRLAPVYDIITTTAYVPGDSMALTLAGSTRWPDRAKLERLASAYCELSPAQINAVIDQVCTAVSETRAELQDYFAESSGPEVGAYMLREWETGLSSIGY